MSVVADWKESLSGSEKPKSEASKVCEASSRMVMVLSVPTGASFTAGVTLKVMVLAD